MLWQICNPCLLLGNTIFLLRVNNKEVIRLVHNNSGRLVYGYGHSDKRPEYKFSQKEINF